MGLKPSIAATFLGTVLLLQAGALPSAMAEEVPAIKLEQLQRVIDGQITAFRKGEHQQAFSYAAPRLQRLFGSTERFIGMVKSGYGPIYGARNWSFTRSRIRGEQVFQEVKLTGPNGREWVALYTMRQQPDGTWRIAGVQMKKADELST